MATLRADKQHVAGDSYVLVVTGTGMAGGLVRCTVKRYLDDPDSAAVAEGDSVDGAVVIDSDTSATVTFGANVTELWPVGLVWYDVQLVAASGAIKTLAFGAIKTLRRITRTRTEPSTHTPLAADAGALALAAGDAAFVRGYTLAADAGALSLAGADAAFSHGYIMPSDVGALVLAGADVTLTYAPILSQLGADLLHHWEPSVATVTLNGANISQLNDRAGGKHLTQATPGNQPLYDATGGPNSQPCVSLDSAAKVLAHTTFSLAAGKRLGVYVIMASPGGASTAIQVQSLKGGIAQPATLYQQSSKFQHNGRPNGGPDQGLSITSPALSTSWLKHSIEYLAAGMESRIGGSVTTPNFTGTVACDAIDTIYIGHSAASASGGKVACILIVDNITTAKRAIVDTYLSSRYGL